MKNKEKEYVALVELFDENGNSSYKSFDFCSKGFLDAYFTVLRLRFEDYNEYDFEIISIHRICEVNDG